MGTAPVAMVMINLPMAKLRELNAVVLPFWMCTISVVIYGVINIINKEHFLPDEEECEKHSKKLFWILTILVNGVCYNLAWQFKVNAYKNDLVTRVAPIFYLETALSMLLDIFLWKIKFSILQFSGLILVLGLFFTILVFAYLREYNKEET